MTPPTNATLSPVEVADRVGKMVAGEQGIQFADLFAVDGVLEYPFAGPGMPERLDGQDAIRSFHSNSARGLRKLFDMQDVTATVHRTADPEVVITEIQHRGMSHVTGRPHHSIAVGIIRVRDGEIVSYRDFMNPLTLAELSGQPVTTETETAGH